MLVAAVTALVGALAASAVRTYLVRAEIAESIAFANYAQNQVTRAFRRTGSPPPGDGNALMQDSPHAQSRYIADLRVVDGRIDVIFGGDADRAIGGRTLSLTPFETADGAVVWVCAGKAPGVGLQPLGFAGGGRVAVQTATTIERRYLPAECRD